MTGIILLLTTCPDRDSARALAAEMVDLKLAACVNLLPEMESFYRWDDQPQQGKERQMIFKTTLEKVDQLQAAVVARHPYSCPEILHIPVSNGYTPYLDWIKSIQS